MLASGFWGWNFTEGVLPLVNTETARVGDILALVAATQAKCACLRL